MKLYECVYTVLTIAVWCSRLKFEKFINSNSLRSIVRHFIFGFLFVIVVASFAMENYPHPQSMQLSLDTLNVRFYFFLSFVCFPPPHTFEYTRILWLCTLAQNLRIRHCTDSHSRFFLSAIGRGQYHSKKFHTKNN